MDIEWYWCIFWSSHGIIFPGCGWRHGGQPQSRYGAFHSHGGTPIAGWFMSGKIAWNLGWWFGVPPFSEPPHIVIVPYVPSIDSPGHQEGTSQPADLGIWALWHRSLSVPICTNMEVEVPHPPNSSYSQNLKDWPLHGAWMEMKGSSKIQKWRTRRCSEDDLC